jgi:hypothetical protein
MLRLNPPTYTPHTRQHPQGHSPASRLRSGNELPPEVSFDMLKANITAFHKYMKSKIKDYPRGKDRWDAILSQINFYVTTIIHYNDQCCEFFEDDPVMIQILEELKLLYPQLLERYKTMTDPNFNMKVRRVNFLNK